MGGQVDKGRGARMRAWASRIEVAEAGFKRVWKNTQAGAVSDGRERMPAPLLRALEKRRAALPANARTE